jgi:hypothetical protein
LPTAYAARDADGFETASKQVSQETGISARTLYRWLADDAAFQRRVDELRHEIQAQMIGRLSDVSLRASEVVGELLESDDPRVRLQAARVAFGSRANMRPFQKVSEQLAAVEQLLASRSQA